MINVETLKQWWDVFIGDGNFTEIRMLGKFSYSGYFNNFDTLCKAIEPYSELEDEQMYFVLNKIDDACYGRQQTEKVVKTPKITTNDNDIVRRRWIMCDFDPVRKSGTNSSNEELEFAHKKAQDVYVFLRDRGFSEPVICMSGNGWHLMFKIDEDVSEETKEIIKGFYKYLAQVFNDEHVDFDQKNFNEARICKLYGTTAKKGANISDRPWRESKIIYVPSAVQTTPLSKFKELADLVPKEEPKPVPNQRRTPYNNAPFDLDSWLNEHGIVYRTKQSGSSTLYELEYCPWVDTHSDRKKWDSALFKDANGKIAFNCTHSHCHGKTWQDVRVYYEPDAYDRQYNLPQYRPRYDVVRQPVYEVKDEIPELGEKWLSLSSIKKIDLNAIERVKTGFTELDKSIMGLAVQEVTLLSGANSSGKSSWIDTLILNVINQGWKTALWSGELPPEILKAWIQLVAAGKHYVKESKFQDGKPYVPQNIGEQIDKWLDGKFYLYNNEYGAKWQQIFSDMEILLSYGVKLFILDNLFSLDIDILDGDKNNKQRELILQIKSFAKKNSVHILLVAHPRKATGFLRKNDVSGTSDLQNAVDNIFIIHRANQDFTKAGAEFFGESYIHRFDGFGNVLEVAKNRMFGIVDLLVGFHYDVSTRRFMNSLDEDVRYGWEENPVQQEMFATNINNEESAPFDMSSEEAPF